MARKKTIIPDDQITTLEQQQPKIEPKTPEMEALLASGYDGMTVEDAETIIKERDADPRRWPLAEYRRAKAFLAAYQTKATVISTREPWRVRETSRRVRRA